jgi:hypothetical protein
MLQDVGPLFSHNLALNFMLHIWLKAGFVEIVIGT